MQHEVNPYVTFKHLEIAHSFAVSNLTSTLNQSSVVLGLFQAGNVSEAKLLFQKVEGDLQLSSPHEFLAWRQFGAFFLKAPIGGSQQRRREVALSAFFKAEEKCQETNLRLSEFRYNPDSAPDGVRIMMYRAREELRRILEGDLDDSRYMECIRASRPGGGAAIGTHNRFRVAPAYKLLDCEPVATPAAVPHFERLLYECPMWSRDLRRLYPAGYSLTCANRIAFVPKDSITDRIIAIEPSCNMWLQLGVHEVLARLLSKTGNSILTQRRNQDLALLGSRQTMVDSLVTVDLSSASDSVTTELVDFLFPPMWAAYLHDLRSTECVLDGKTVKYHKISSMGNGYTFAVETLIFLSLARAANSLSGAKLASVYGDDIIVPWRSYGALLELLTFAGFSVNLHKTFTNGPFRESCGIDAWGGLPVTPKYVRLGKLRVSDVYDLINTLNDTRLSFGSVKALLWRSLRATGVTVVRTHPCFPSSSGIWTEPFALIRDGLAKYSSSYQGYMVKTLQFSGSKEPLPDNIGCLSSLLSGGEAIGALRGSGKFRVRWSRVGGNTSPASELHPSQRDYLPDFWSGQNI